MFVLAEEPFLDRCEGNDARDSLSHDPGHACFDPLGQFAHTAGLEEVSYLKTQTLLAESTDQLNGADRIASELKEVVIQPDLLNSQYRGQNIGQRLLSRCGGRLIVSRGCDGETGQGTSVDLPAPIHGESFQADEVARYHVGWQPFTEELPQFTAFHLPTGDVIQDEFQCACRRFPGQDAGLRDPWVLARVMLNVSRFNSESPDLDLIVPTPQETQCAIYVPGAEIARAIQDVAFSEGIGDKSLPRQLGPVQVAASNTIAACADLSRDPHRAQLEILIQYIDRRIRDRLADGNIHVRSGNPVPCREGRILCRAVDVEDLELRVGVVRTGNVMRRNFLATGQDPLQITENEGVGLYHLVEETRRDEHGRHALVADLAAQKSGLQQILTPREVDAPTIQQGTPDLERRSIERQ